MLHSSGLSSKMTPGFTLGLIFKISRSLCFLLEKGGAAGPFYARPWDKSRTREIKHQRGNAKGSWAVRPDGL